MLLVICLDATAEEHGVGVHTKKNSVGSSTERITDRQEITHYQRDKRMSIATKNAKDEF